MLFARYQPYKNEVSVSEKFWAEKGSKSGTVESQSQTHTIWCLLQSVKVKAFIIHFICTHESCSMSINLDILFTELVKNGI